VKFFTAFIYFKIIKEKTFMVAVTVIALIVAFILLDMGIQYFRKARMSEMVSHASTKVEELLSDFLMPLGVFFHPGHTWVRIQDRGEIIVGTDDFVQKSLGTIDRVELPKVGSTVRSNSPAFRLFQGSKYATFLAPINGTVIAVNEQVKQNPEVMKDQPYESGWVMKIKPSSAAEDLKSLMIADPAVKWLKREVSAFRDFLSEIAGKKSELGLTLADGGIPISGVMEGFGNSEWNSFQQNFLNKKV
jgi:glycine cleavage system H lipoate-binding protein